MSSDATALPALDAPSSGAGRARLGAIARPQAIATLGLAAIVLLSLLVVVMAADRPSLLSPTTHVGFFPHWMAGPLGGLWPGLTGNGTTLKYLFSGAIVAMYIGYVGVLRHSEHVASRLVVGGIVAVHAIFILSPPLALTDLFNYINYGRMEVVHNLNPYTSIPILEPHNDPSYALSNWHQLLSPYGPLFTLITFAVVPLGVAGSFWVLKVLLAATSLGTILLVYRSAKLLGRDPIKAVALVGLNPIVLVWGLGGDHNDFLMVFFIMLGLYLLLLAKARRPGGEPSGWLLPLDPLLLGAGGAFVIATGLKASAAVLVPVVLAGLLRDRRALVQALVGMALFTALVGAVSLLAFGLHIPDLSTQSKLVTSESIPNLIGLAIGSGGEGETLHHVMSAALVLAVAASCWFAWRASEENAPERTIVACGWATVALLATLSWVLPWYVLWLLPLAALSRSRRLRNVALVYGVYLIVAWAPVSGLLWNAIGFHPEKTSLGRLHQRYVRELLN